ncbi:antibiotic acetyltransferase, partial [Cribrihabitans sp. XS_ASV171]
TGAIIGAGAVVRGEIPPYAIVTGNPGRATRYRFAPERIAALLEAAWWDWPAEQLSEALPALMKGDLPR